MKVLQNKIINSYYDIFKNYSGNLNLSVPLVPRITERYLKNRIVIIGQETNTWYRGSENDLFEFLISKKNKLEEICLVNRYDRFVKESAEKYGGKFWQFSKDLYCQEIIPGNMVENNKLGHCWLNVFLVEACKNKKDKYGRPTSNPNLANKILSIQKDLLRNVLLLLEPKLILFLTGPSLDKIIRNNIFSKNEISFNQIDRNNIISPRQLARIQVNTNSPFKKCQIFRAYHPSYFMGYINSHRSLKQKLKNGNKTVSNSKYYFNTFISELHKVRNNWL